MTDKFPPLPAPVSDERYAIIYADPPWDYKGQLQHAGPGSGDSGGAIRHYETVQLQDLIELDVASIAADDSLLFMWATSPHLDQAIDLGKAWGFAWATVAFVWGQTARQPRLLHDVAVRAVPGLQARTDSRSERRAQRATIGLRATQRSFAQADRSEA